MGYTIVLWLFRASIVVLVGYLLYNLVPYWMGT